MKLIIFTRLFLESDKKPSDFGKSVGKDAKYVRKRVAKELIIVKNKLGGSFKTNMVYVKNNRSEFLNYILTYNEILNKKKLEAEREKIKEKELSEIERSVLLDDLIQNTRSLKNSQLRRLSEQFKVSRQYENRYRELKREFEKYKQLIEVKMEDQAIYETKHSKRDKGMEDLKMMLSDEGAFEKLLQEAFTGKSRDEVLQLFQNIDGNKFNSLQKRRVFFEMLSVENFLILKNYLK